MALDLSAFGIKKEKITPVEVPEIEPAFELKENVETVQVKGTPIVKPLSLKEIWQYRPTLKEFFSEVVPKASTAFARGVGKELTKSFLTLDKILSSTPTGKIQETYIIPKKEVEEHYRWREETLAKTEPTPEEIPGSLAAQTGMTLLLYQAVASTTAPISTGMSKIITTHFPELTLTKGGATLARIMTDAPRIAATLGEVNFIKELASQTAKEDYSFTKLAGETFRGIMFGGMLGVAGAPPTLTQRLVTAATLGGGFSAIETLIKNGQITEEDVPKILFDTAVATGITYMGTRLATGEYQRQLDASRARYITEQKYGKEFADSLAKLDAYIIMRGGIPIDQQTILLPGVEPQSDIQIAWSTKNKLLASVKKLNVDYVIAARDELNALKVLEVSPKPDLPLSEFLVPEEKALLQQLKNVGDVPSSLYLKYTEPEPRIRELSIKEADIITKIDEELGLKVAEIKPEALKVTEIPEVTPGIRPAMMPPEIKPAVEEFQPSIKKEVNIETLKYSEKVKDVIAKVQKIGGDAIEEIRVVGSQVTGEAKPTSDVDLFIQTISQKAADTLDTSIHTKYEGAPISVQVTPQKYEATVAGIPEERPNLIVFQKELGKEVAESPFKAIVIRNYYDTVLKELSYFSKDAAKAVKAADILTKSKTFSEVLEGIREALPEKVKENEALMLFLKNRELTLRMTEQEITKVTHPRAIEEFQKHTAMQIEATYKEPDSKEVVRIIKELNLEGMTISDAENVMKEALPEKARKHPRVADAIRNWANQARLSIQQLEIMERKEEVEPKAKAEPIIPEAISWLKAYTRAEPGKIPSKLPSSEVIKQLSQYKPDKPVTLYRGIQKGETDEGKALLSYTYDRDAAALHTRDKSVDPYDIGEIPAKVIEDLKAKGLLKVTKIDPENILVDSTLMPSDLAIKSGFVLDEEEVIVMREVPKIEPEAIKELEKAYLQWKKTAKPIDMTKALRVNPEAARELQRKSIEYLKGRNFTTLWRFGKDKDVGLISATYIREVVLEQFEGLPLTKRKVTEIKLTPEVEKRIIAIDDIIPNLPRGLDEAEVLLTPKGTTLESLIIEGVKPTEPAPPERRPPTAKRLLGIPKPRLITRGEDVLLRMKLRAEARGARLGEKAARAEIKQKLKDSKDVQRALNIIRSQLKKITIRRLRPERQENIRQIMEDFDFAALIPRTERRLRSRLHYILREPENQIPDAKIAELIRLDKKPLSDLTIDDLILIRDAIQHEIKLNELKNKLIFGKRYFETKSYIDRAVKNVNSKATAIKENPNLIDSTLVAPRTGSLRRVFTIDSYTPELITEIFDRKKHGVIRRLLYDGIDEGTTEMLRNQQEAEDWLHQQMKGINIDRWSRTFQSKEKNLNIETVTLTNGKQIKLTKADRISFLLHSKNKRNLRHILIGGFRFENNLGTKYNITKEDLDLIIQSATPNEVKIANTFHRFLNVIQKAKINETSMNLNGWEIAKEPDYWPIRTASLDRQRDALKMKKSFTQLTLEGMGIFKERVDASNALIIEDAFKVMYIHIQKTSGYIGLAVPLRNAKMLLQDSKFTESVLKTYSREYYKALENYLRDIESNTYEMQGVEQLTVDLINKLDVALLGLNPFVMLKQPISYITASVEMDSKHLLRAIKTKTNPEEIAKWSPQLRHRLKGNITRELGELGRVGTIKQFFTHKRVFSNVFMSNLGATDFIAVGRIWNAVKFEMQNKHPELKGDELMKAVSKRAEEVIRRTQATFLMKDRSAIGRSPSVWVRLFTKYTSERNKNYNAIRRAMLEYDIGQKTIKSKITLIRKLFTLLIASSLAINMIDELRNRLYDSGKKNRTLLSRAVGVVANAMSYVYFLGDVFSSIVSRIQYGDYGSYGSFMSNNPVASFLNNVEKIVADTYKVIDQVITNEKYKSGEHKGEEKWRISAVELADEVTSVVSKFKGIPYDTVKKILQGTWEILSGERAIKEEEEREKERSKRSLY